MAVVVGMSARHLAEIMDGTASPGPHHVKWIRRRLTEEEAEAILSGAQRRDIGDRFIRGGLGSVRETDTTGWTFNGRCLAGDIRPGDLVLVSHKGTVVWAEVMSTAVSDNGMEVHITLANGEVASLWPHSQMRIARRPDGKEDDDDDAEQRPGDDR